MDISTEHALGTPPPIFSIFTAFCQAKTLMSAVELGLFTLLAEAPATEVEIRERLALHPRVLPDFLDTLVALGMLERNDRRYRNSLSADLYLDQHKPSYLGPLLDLLNLQFPAWDRLTRALRTGEAQMEGYSGGSPFDDWYQDLDAVRNFIAAMDVVNGGIGPELARSLDWSSYDSFVDLGGARGNVAAELVKTHPHLRGACFDLPQVKPLFDEHMARLGLADQERVRFYSGDFFVDPLPEADVLIFGDVLHDWDQAQRQALLKKAFFYVRPGGALLVYDPMIDDDRRGKLFNLLLSLNMMLVTPGGSEYTAADCCLWLAQAGFESTSAVPLANVATLVIARKGH